MHAHAGPTEVKRPPFKTRARSLLCPLPFTLALIAASLTVTLTANAYTLVKPFRATASGNLYRVSAPPTIDGVKLVGYRRQRLSVTRPRRNLHDGVLAVSPAAP